MNDPGTHKLSEAMKGHEPHPINTETSRHAPAEPQGPGSTPEGVAEEARREHEARPEAIVDRDRKLTEIGRGQQTHG